MFNWATIISELSPGARVPNVIDSAKTVVLVWSESLAFDSWTDKNTPIELSSINVVFTVSSGARVVVVVVVGGGVVVVVVPVPVVVVVVVGVVEVVVEDVVVVVTGVEEFSM